MEDGDPLEPPPLPFTRIARLNGPEWKYMVVGCTCSFLMGSAMPVFSVLFGEIIGVSNLQLFFISSNIYDEFKIF